MDDGSMSKEAMSEALQAIHDTALYALKCLTERPGQKASGYHRQ
jgi:hypothetical protein